MNPERLIVVAAVIEREGRVLIGRRSAEGSFALKWEFPGGKVEPGEPPRVALERELEEELGIEATIGPEIVSYEYCYPGRNPVLLVFYAVISFQGEPRNRVFDEIRWELPEKLPLYDFLEGDVEFVRWLATSGSPGGPERYGPCSTSQ